MPLSPGSSQEIVSRNISEMVHAGYPQRQAVAASLDNARRHPHAQGGNVASALRLVRAHRDVGGGMGIPPAVPFFERQDIRGAEHPQGVIESTVPGRTDHVPLTVPAGSYVMPADVVSGLGEGNTNAGVHVLDKMLHSGPYGMQLHQSGHGGMGIPHPPPMTREQHEAVYAKGGATKPNKQQQQEQEQGGDVPIMAAGGEYIVPPDVVQHHPLLGAGNMKRGHNILDHWVKALRKKHIKEVTKLPGPAK